MYGQHCANVVMVEQVPVARVLRNTNTHYTLHWQKRQNLPIVQYCDYTDVKAAGLKIISFFYSFAVLVLPETCVWVLKAPRGERPKVICIAWGFYGRIIAFPLFVQLYSCNSDQRKGSVSQKLRCSQKCYQLSSLPLRTRIQHSFQSHIQAPSFNLCKTIN